jgi:hypothetical protein
MFKECCCFIPRCNIKYIRLSDSAEKSIREHDMAQVPLWKYCTHAGLINRIFFPFLLVYGLVYTCWQHKHTFGSTRRTSLGCEIYSSDWDLWLGVCASLYFIIIIVSSLQKKSRARICIIFAGLFHFKCWCRWSVPPNPAEQTKLVEHIVYVYQWLSLSLYTSEWIANTSCAFKHHAFKAYRLSTGYYWIYLLYCGPWQ